MFFERRRVMGAITFMTITTIITLLFFLIFPIIEGVVEYEVEKEMNAEREGLSCPLSGCEDIWEKKTDTEWCWKSVDSKHLSTDILTELSEEEILRIMAAREKNNFFLIRREDIERGWLFTKTDTKIFWRKERG